MRKRKIFDALNSQSTLWIKASAARPSIYMGKSTILLHYLILRKRGEKCTYSLRELCEQINATRAQLLPPEAAPPLAVNPEQLELS